MNPIAVIISDVHYSLPTLSLADAATNMAIDTANELKVPLIVAGDLHDTKANLRGECVEAMIKTFRRCEIPAIVLVGNHDLTNERAKTHSLEFLRAYANLVDEPIKNLIPYWTFIPYQSDVEELRAYLKTLKPKSNIIMHQGIVGTNSGDYIQDKSAITQQDVIGRRVISGHYHTRQTIELPDGGKWDFVGNPFTLTYGEAQDPAKGFQILYEDGNLEFVPTKLRRHVVINMSFCLIENTGEYALLLNSAVHPGAITEKDLVWIKVSGTREQLNTVEKNKLAKGWNLKQSFKLDLIPLDTISQVSTTQNSTKDALLDSLIDSLTNTSNERKNRLKDLWKEML